MGRGIDSRNRVWNRVAKLHRLAARYDNPMPTWFLAPIAGLKLPTQVLSHWFTEKGVSTNSSVRSGQGERVRVRMRGRLHGHQLRD
jgi:hypothetical protein